MSKAKSKDHGVWGSCLVVIRVVCCMVVHHVVIPKGPGEMRRELMR